MLLCLLSLEILLSPLQHPSGSIAPSRLPPGWTESLRGRGRDEEGPKEKSQSSMKRWGMDVTLCGCSHPNPPMGFAREERIYPTGMATFGCLTVVGSVRDAPVDRLNKQGGAASQSFGV